MHFDFDQSMNEFMASDQSNNWRRLHGFPLRRKMHNQKYKDRKKATEQGRGPIIMGCSGAGKTRYFCFPTIRRGEV